jgi:uncharacterized protein YdhG (YjbR/CyaY superfamily)
MMQCLKLLSVHVDAPKEIAPVAAASLKDAVTDRLDLAKSGTSSLSSDKHDRTLYFPKIEAKYGQPMRYWHSVMKEISDLKYPQQIAYLKQEHGFSQTHANALVMYSRGSKTTRRFDDLAGFLAQQDPAKAKTVKKIFKVIQMKYPKLELVIAWNQPMLKLGSQYLFGVSVAKNHVLIAPFNTDVLKAMERELADYKVNKKTVQVPVDWKVDEKLLHKMIRLNLKALKKYKSAT